MDFELAILPNPVMESTLIKSYIPENYSNAELVIINSNGATVFIEPVSNGSIEKKIDTTDWSDGIYLVMIKVQD